MKEPERWHVWEVGEVVGVEQEVAEFGAAQQRRQGGEGVAREIDVLQRTQLAEESVGEGGGRGE